MTNAFITGIISGVVFGIIIGIIIGLRKKSQATPSQGQKDFANELEEKKAANIAKLRVLHLLLSGEKWE